MKRFVDIIEEIHPIPVGVVVEFDVFRAISTRDRIRISGPQGDPYHLALQILVNELTKEAALATWPPSRLAMVLAEKSKIAGTTGKLWEGMSDIWGPCLDSYSFASPNNISPLQAA